LNKRQSQSKTAQSTQLKHLKTRIFALTLTQTLSGPIEILRKYAFYRLQSRLSSLKTTRIALFPPLLKPIFNVINQKRVTNTTAVHHAAISLARVSKTAKYRLIEAGFAAIRWKVYANIAISKLETSVKAALSAYHQQRVREGMVRWQGALLAHRVASTVHEKATAYQLSASVRLLAAVERRRVRVGWKGLSESTAGRQGESRAVCTTQQTTSLGKADQSSLMSVTRILHYKRLERLLYAFSSLQSLTAPIEYTRTAAARLQVCFRRIKQERLRIAFRNVKIHAARQIFCAKKLANIGLYWDKKVGMRRLKGIFMLKKGILHLISVKNSHLRVGFSNIKAAFKQRSRIKQAFDQLQASSSSLQRRIRPQMKRTEWERACKRRVAGMLGRWRSNWQRERVRVRWG
jgi:hypothetical protein